MNDRDPNKEPRTVLDYQRPAAPALPLRTVALHIAAALAGIWAVMYLVATLVAGC